MPPFRGIKTCPRGKNAHKNDNNQIFSFLFMSFLLCSILIKVSKKYLLYILLIEI
jgi:hypothetical protein